jgi:glutamine synthetase
VLRQAAELGVGLNLGIECEVFVVRLTDEGKLEVPNPDDDLTKSCYDIKRFMDRYTWLDKVAAAINELGWDLYSFDHEDANSQFEPKNRLSLQFLKAFIRLAKLISKNN